MGGENDIHDYPTLEAFKDISDIVLEMGTKAVLGKFNLGHLTIDKYEKANHLTPTPLSKQMRLWTYEDVREFNQPYVKKAYHTDKTNLSTIGYSDWVADRIYKLGK